MKHLFFSILLLFSTQIFAQQSNNGECLRCKIVASITEGALKACPKHVKLRDSKAKSTFESFKKDAQSADKSYDKMTNSSYEHYIKAGKCAELKQEVEAAMNGTGGSFGRNLVLLATR